MIAPLRPTLRFEPPPQPLLPADHHSDGGVALAIGLLAFVCMIPYPAVGIGNTSALQIGNALTLLMMVPVMMLPWTGRMFWMVPVFIAPMVISTLKVGLTKEDDVGLAVKSLLPCALSALTLWIPQLYGRKHALDMLTGIAIAMLLHTGVGFWQLYCFTSGVFPFPDFYVNQSFLSVKDNAVIIARYTQRPFGLFPEPSAMSSSLAPFILFIAAHLCGIVKLKQTPARWQNMLFGAAGVGALLLIILSQSGHSAVTLAALLLFAVIWLGRCRATLRTYGMIVAVTAVVLPALLWFAALSLSNRVGGSEMGNSSWEERSMSLKLGFLMLFEGDYLRVIFGMGVGLIAPVLHNRVQIDAVFSVLLNYLYETGLVGVAAVGVIGHSLVKTWKASRFSSAWVAIAVVWLVGITLTTSYLQLLPIWLTLGWLSVWNEICEPAVAHVGPVSNVTTAQVPILEPGVRWTPGKSGATLADSRIELTHKPNQRWTDK